MSGLLLNRSLCAECALINDSHLRTASQLAGCEAIANSRDRPEPSAESTAVVIFHFAVWIKITNIISTFDSCRNSTLFRFAQICGILKRSAFCPNQFGQICQQIKKGIELLALGITFNANCGMSFDVSSDVFVMCLVFFFVGICKNTDQSLILLKNQISCGKR